MEASKFDQDPLLEMVEVDIAEGLPFDQLVDPLDDPVAVSLFIRLGHNGSRFKCPKHAGQRIQI